MSSELVEPQGEQDPLQQKKQQEDLQNNPGSKPTSIAYSRYELRAPRKSLIENNVSRKRKAADHGILRPSNKRQKAGGDPSDQGPRVDDSGGVCEKLKVDDPCDQRLQSGDNGLTEVRIKESDFVSVINRRIEVFWPLEETWYVGNIKRYDAYNKLHHVVYDDGEEEWVSLERERYRIQVAPGEFGRVSSRSRKRNVDVNSENRGFVHRKHFDGNRGFVQKRSDVSVGDGASFVQKTSTDDLQKDGIDDGGYVVQKNGLSGATHVLKRRGIDGYAEVVQSGNDGLQKRYDARRKALKRNSKQVMNVGFGDLTETYDGVSVGFDSGNKRLGKVRRYDPTNKLQLVEYDDGEEEWVPLERDDNVVSGEISGAPSSGIKGSVLESADFRGSGQSKHVGTEILEKTENDRLQADDGRRRKRRKKDSKQVTYDVQKNYDNSDSVDYASTVRGSVLEHKTQSNVGRASVPCVGDSGINSGSVVFAAGIVDSKKDCDGGLGGDSKQVKNTDIDDLQRDCVDSGSSLLDSVQEFETQGNVGQISFSTAFGNPGNNSDSKEGFGATTEDQEGFPSVLHQRKTPAITYSRKRQHNSKRGYNLFQDESGKGRNSFSIGHRTEAKPKVKGKTFKDEMAKVKGKTVKEEMGAFSGLENDSIVLKQPLDRIGTYHFNDKNGSSSSGNDSITQQQPVNAYFRRRKRSCTGNMDIKAQVKVCYKSNQSLEQMLMFYLKKLTVNEALKMHVSPLNLRQPSYCPCVAPGLQLCNRGSGMACFELVKSQSMEYFVLLLQSLLQFSCAYVLQSSSSHSALQQFRVGTLNPINLMNLSPLEFVKLTTSLSDIQMQVLIVDTLSNVRKFYLSGSFWEVLRNFVLSLVPVMGFGALRSANLHVAFQSITLQISSVQGGLSFTCNFENNHGTRSAKQAERHFLSKGLHPTFGKLIKGESSGGSSANCVGPSILPGRLVFERDANYLNGLHESSETQYITSFHQYSCRSLRPHTKNDFCTFQTIPAFQMSFSSAPSFFAYLHMRLSFGKGICLDCSQSHGSVSFNSNNSLNSSYAETGIVESHKHLLPGIIPNVEERARFSREIQSSIHAPVKRVKLEENIFAIAENQRVQLATPSVEFDSNVIGRVSDKQLKRYNLLPILKIRRTNHNSWHFAGVLSPPPFVGETSRVMFPRAAGTSNHMESSQSGGSRSTSENADDAVLRSARSRRRGRPRRQSSQEKLNEMGVNFSKLRAEIDSVVCSANILIFGKDRCWRESGAEVRLVHRSNEWVLDVNLHGSTKVTYKAQEQKVRSSQEKKQRVPSKPNCYTMIWTGGQNWSLEFPDRTQWSLFKDLYEECYNRNFRAASVKDHPTPAVCLLSNESTSTVDVPFVLPLNYIKAAEDELSRTLSRSNIYDMDSDDEQWLFQLNSKYDHDDSSGFDKVSEDTFERVISSLEKAAFFQLQSLTIEDAIQTCSGLVPEEVLASIYSYWLEKREKKKDLYWYGSRGSVGVKALVPQFEMKGKESLPQTKRRGKIFRGKSYTGQHNVRTTGKHGVRNHIEMQHKKRQQRQVNGVSFGSGCISHASELQQQHDNEVSFGNGCPSYALEPQQQQEVNRLYTGNGCSSDALEPQQQQQVNGESFGNGYESRALVLVSEEEAIVHDAKRYACDAGAIAVTKRARSQRLLQKADYAIFKAVKALKIAETIEISKEARLSRFVGSVFSPSFATDHRVDENSHRREGSIGSPSWALSTYGH